MVTVVYIYILDIERVPLEENYFISP